MEKLLNVLGRSEQKRLRSKYGDWALVTGATSGIGREIALQLAHAGFNLFISARHSDRLIEMENDLRASLSIQAISIPADASTNDGVAKIIEATKSSLPGLVVLAAGFGTSGLLTNSDIEQEVNMLDLNCRGLLILTHHFGQIYSAQKSGGIILMSSMVAFQGTPYGGNYAATKAYVQTLVEGLAVEMKPFGVDILAAAPGPVNSGFSSRANMEMGAAMSPDQIAAPILRAMGRKSVVLPGFLTKMLVFALSTLPRWAKVRIMGKVMGGFTQHQRK